MWRLDDFFFVALGGWEVRDSWGLILFVTRSSRTSMAVHWFMDDCSGVFFMFFLGEMTGHEIRIQEIWGTDQLLTGAHGNVISVISQQAATYKAEKKH